MGKHLPSLTLEVQKIIRKLHNDMTSHERLLGKVIASTYQSKVLDINFITLQHD